MKFCNDTAFRNQVIDLLVQMAPLKSASSNLEGIYQKFILNFGATTSSKELIPTTLSFSHMGHDLPIWMEGAPFKDKQNSKFIEESFKVEEESPLGEDKQKRVMIIGQDPMRKDPNLGNIQVSSPWGLHSPKAHANHATFHKNLINPLLENGCCIYVTDRWKLFMANGNSVSDSRKNIVGMADFDVILRKEVELFEPAYIIILSKDKKLYKGIQKAVRKSFTGSFIVLPHVNARLKKGELKKRYEKCIDKIKKQ